MDMYDDYLKAENALSEARVWNDLPNGKKYQNDKFNISTALCELNLVRAGQQYEGGKSYWEAPPELVSEILKIISKDQTIIERALENLSKKTTELLSECEQETKERLNKIQKAKEELGK